MKILAAAFVASGLISNVAAASEPGPVGYWLVADGTAIIEVKRCGKALCGYVAAAPAPEPGAKSAIGQQILIDFVQDGAIWRGTIFNIDDGQSYAGEINQEAEGLKVKGCLPNGFCGGETWRSIKPQQQEIKPAQPQPKLAQPQTKQAR